jgi:antitoxin VapB
MKHLASADTLARQLAKTRHTTMTEALVSALENEWRQDRKAAPLAVRLRALAERAKAMAGPRARAMTKDEIDDLSGPSSGDHDAAARLSAFSAGLGPDPLRRITD